MATATLRSISVALLAAGLFLPRPASTEPAPARSPGPPVPAESTEAGPSAPVSIPLAPEQNVRVSLEGGRTFILLVRAAPGDTWATLASHLLDEGASPAAVAAANPARPVVTGGSWYRVPVGLLSPVSRGRALTTLFPSDGPSEKGWTHRPGASLLDSYGEGAWEVALWFTGDGSNFEPILRANGLSDPLLPRGIEVTIPGDLLLAPFRLAWQRWRAGGGVAGPARPPHRERSRALDQKPDSRGKDTGETRPGEGQSASSGANATGDRLATGSVEEDTLPSPASAEGSTEATGLSYARDAEGEYASYQLRRGEALYSAVVVRFTGRVDPDDVSEAAAIIAKRSGIHDVTGIPVGFEVKIPRPMLLPEFLPPADRKRKEVEARRRETAKVTNAVRTRNLAGIHVILDAGHGGVDPGAIIAGLAEHEYVYDVMCRVKRLLETTTAATVHPTIEEPSLEFEPRSGRVLRASGNGRILTTPEHVNGDPGETSLGVNLRWYLANSIARRVVRSGLDPARTVFASFHADVLYPTLRGAMVYVPGEKYRRGAFACREAECARYAEVREAPVIRFSRNERLGSEGLSRQFAARLISAFRKGNIPVHPYQPVRDRIIRRGRDWLPAVLRGNSVPVKVLVELVNLNNPDDRALIQEASFRQALARAFVDGLLDYYGSPDADGAPPAHGRKSR